MTTKRELLDKVNANKRKAIAAWDKANTNWEKTGTARAKAKASAAWDKALDAWAQAIADTDRANAMPDDS